MLINVLKFGGTSVANLKRIENVVKIVEKRIKDNSSKIILVVSAMSGVTNKLVKEFKKITNEISTTPGYEFNQQNSITAKSGKHKYNFDISQQSFAWIADNKVEKKMIRTMKKGSRIMISGYNKSGSQTIDHYSLLGFTKAYNEAKKSCS